MKKRALLIGINDYFVLNGLSCARQDAESLAETLQIHCGFDESEITIMTCTSEGGTRATSRFIEHAMADLTEARDLDLLIFGFWGHGFAPQPGKRYLCGIDTVESDLERTAVSLDLAKAKLAQVGAMNTLLVLDCCQNRPPGRGGAATLEEGAERQLASMARDIQAAGMGESIERVPTVAIMNACREGQRAYEWESRGHGVFTAHLLDGLRTGKASIAQLATWVCDKTPLSVQKLHHQKQIPWFTIEGRGDIVLPQEAGRARQGAVVAKSSSPTSAFPSQPPQPAQLKPIVHWWVIVDGDEAGPLDESAVRNLIKQSKITRKSECWRDGMDAWQPIGKTDEWADAFPPRRKAPPAAKPPKRKPTIHLPDFIEPVPDAECTRLGGLNAGSEAAQKHQLEWVEKGYPLEVKMRETRIVFRLIPPGEFLMGSKGDSEAFADERIQHKVTINSPMYVGKFPITQEQWQAVMGGESREIPDGCGHEERRHLQARETIGSRYEGPSGRACFVE